MVYQTGPSIFYQKDIIASSFALEGTPVLLGIAWK